MDRDNFCVGIYSDGSATVGDPVELNCVVNCYIGIGVVRQGVGIKSFAKIIGKDGGGVGFLRNNNSISRMDCVINMNDFRHIRCVVMNYGVFFDDNFWSVRLRLVVKQYCPKNEGCNVSEYFNPIFHITN